MQQWSVCTARPVKYFEERQKRKLRWRYCKTLNFTGGTQISDFECSHAVPVGEKVMFWEVYEVKRKEVEFKGEILNMNMKYII